MQGATDGVGTVNFNGSQTLAGNVGATSNKLALVNIANSVTLSASSFDIKATSITLGSSSVLNISSGALVGAVDGTSASVGTVNFASVGSYLLASGINAIGTTNGLAAVNVTGVSAVSAGDNIKATTVTIGNGSMASLDLAASKNHYW